ncbi:hypothetical protein ASPZODRAFT_19073 [Penicilliopsis zonata CBS 506.65]|uniref:Uncharacterized protein n=1 Tax=Penicilliopsis zonata CBS 506.65 TaxID=1073090 RepID=A0A1L9S9F5_9EURO|nr:hypothetical protein ASPZODRAFT_19073 [Penicilliopsis zonata CBS 506.65]OJJ43768.1 hypothetical protein ASPZODRAFT_19073 [Penicilliopsis zonata CBS 506.65]
MAEGLPYWELRDGPGACANSVAAADKQGGLSGQGESPERQKTCQEPEPGHESDIKRPRTNPNKTGKRTPEAVRWSKTGHDWVTLQRQLNKPLCGHEISAVDIPLHPSASA